MADRTILEATVKDVSFKFTVPTETQMVLIARDAARADGFAKGGNYQDAVYAVADALDIIEGLVVEESDRTELIKLMSKGELEVSELMDVITKVATEAAPRPKPRVRRGSAK